MPDTPNEDLLLTAAEIQGVTNREMPEQTAQAIAVMATDAVRDYCGWRVAKRKTETITVASRGTRSVFLPTLHIHNVVAVSESGEPLAVERDFDWGEGGVLLRLNRRGWATGRRALQVTIDHGYDQCPGGIAQAIASAVARGALVPAGGLVSEGAIGQTRAYARTSSGLVAGSAFAGEELERLDRHRIGASR